MYCTPSAFLHWLFPVLSCNSSALCSLAHLSSSRSLLVWKMALLSINTGSVRHKLDNDHRIIEFFRLEKTLKIISSNH